MLLVQYAQRSLTFLTLGSESASNFRFATGEVKGKYGYLDSNGELREVEYGATPERGFEPRAEGLVLPPPTLDSDYDADEAVAAPASVTPAPVAEPEQPAARFDNFRPAPEGTRRKVVVRKKDRRTRLPIRGNGRPRPAPRKAAPAPRPLPRPAPAAAAAPVRFVAPNARTHAGFNGHPANDIDLATGSFSVFYSGR